MHRLLSISVPRLQEAEFERSRVMIKNIVDSCSELTSSVEQALEVVKLKVERN
jgi:hypothetical protein